MESYSRMPSFTDFTHSHQKMPDDGSLFVILRAFVSSRQVEKLAREIDIQPYFVEQVDALAASP